MASDQDPSSMGANCSLKSCVEFMFKDHYRNQMSNLLHKIIADASNPGFPIDTDTRREANLKKNMVLIRGIPNSWDDLTDKCADGTKPPDVMMKEVLDILFQSQSEIGITDLLCSCTYVADVCSTLILSTRGYDENDENELAKIDEMENIVEKIVAMFIDYILAQNMMACRDFLFWLDFH